MTPTDHRSTGLPCGFCSRTSGAGDEDQVKSQLRALMTHITKTSESPDAPA